MHLINLTEALKSNGLKVTPQRLAILGAIMDLRNHPTAENIKDYVKMKNPSIATGTLYHILDILVDKGLVKKVKTEKDIMRYDANLEKHHHLYCKESHRIEDYYDYELNDLIENYFKSKKIPNFRIDDIHMQLTGSFEN